MGWSSPQIKRDVTIGWSVWVITSKNCVCGKKDLLLPSLPTSALEWQGRQTVKLKIIINWNKQSQEKGKNLFKMQIYPTDMYSHHLTGHPKQTKSKNKREHLFSYNEIITLLYKYFSASWINSKISNQFYIEII